MENEFVNNPNLYPSIVTISLMSFTTSILFGLLAAADNILFFIIYATLEQFAPELITVPGVPQKDQLRCIIILMSVRSLAQNIIMVRLIFKDAKWEILKYATPVSAVFCVLGCIFLDLYSHTTWLRPIFGIIFGIFGLIALFIRMKKTWIQKQREDVARKRKEEGESQVEFSTPKRNLNKAKLALEIHAFSPVGSQLTPAEYEEVQNEKLNNEDYLGHIRPWMIVACGFSAILGATISVSGPPFLLAGLILEFPKELARSTFPLIALTTYATRFLYNIFAGHVTDPALFSVPHALNIALGGTVGVIIGDGIGRIVDNETYLQLISSFLLCAGLSIGGANVFLLWGLLVICFIWIAWSKTIGKS